MASPYKMKNSVLRKSAVSGSPMQKSYGNDKLKKALEKKSDKELQEIAARQLEAGVRLSDFRNRDDQSAPVDSMRTSFQILKERDIAKKKN